jgi:hypothetical protein
MRHVAPLVVDYFASAARPVPRHIARLIEWLIVDYSSRRLVVDYFTYAVRPGASARRAARRRLLRLHHASGCFGTSRGSSSGSS